MSLKENIELIKEELNSEEKMLEGIVKIERFYKKYKIIIISSVLIIITLSILLSWNHFNQLNNHKNANIAFTEFLKNNDNQEAVNQLKKTNYTLFEVAQYIKAKNDKTIPSITVPILEEILQYRSFIQEQDLQQLDQLLQIHGFILKDFVLLEKAIRLVETQRYSQAKESLQLITPQSNLQTLIEPLKHLIALNETKVP